MSLYRKNLGTAGETMAAEYLKGKGYKILSSNYRTRWGEIDLIAVKDDKVIFAEVKTKVGTAKGKPYEAVTRGKRMRVMRAVEYYLLKNPLKKYKLSLDIISIILTPELEVDSIMHIQDSA